ncbi:hypothetical protein D3C78_1325840 [compost metagenome]
MTNAPDGLAEQQATLTRRLQALSQGQTKAMAIGDFFTGSEHTADERSIGQDRFHDPNVCRP